MPIRIMHVVNNLGKGGLENGLVNLIERLDPRRFEHVVCTLAGLGPNAERLAKEQVQVLALRDADSNSRFQTPALVRAIRQFRPDIVHSRNWGAIEAVVAARVARGRRCRPQRAWLRDRCVGERAAAENVFPQIGIRTGRPRPLGVLSTQRRTCQSHGVSGAQDYGDSQRGGPEAVLSRCGNPRSGS